MLRVIIEVSVFVAAWIIASLSFARRLRKAYDKEYGQAAQARAPMKAAAAFDRHRATSLELICYMPYGEVVTYYDIDQACEAISMRVHDDVARKVYRLEWLAPASEARVNQAGRQLRSV